MNHARSKAATTGAFPSTAMMIDDFR